MSLTLCLRHPIPLGLDLGRFFAEALPKARRLAALERIKVPYGRAEVRIGDIFRISGSLSDEVTIAAGALGRNMHRLGGGWSTGVLLVEGDAGHRCGSRMSGGRIVVEGDCGDLAAAGMSGGELIVRGSCGDLAAAATEGAVEGMSGGSLRVYGSVGDRLAERMRRGTIVIDGDCGKYAAAFMKGGNVIIKGKTAAGVGYFLRRGSLFLLGGAPRLAAGWKPCGECELAFFGLLAKTAASLPPKMRRYAGDLASVGKGELFIP